MYFLGPDNGKGGDYVFHAYYQWVPFFLCLQILLFYAPHWIWKQLEDGHLKKIMLGLGPIFFSIKLNDSLDSDS